MAGARRKAGASSGAPAARRPPVTGRKRVTAKPAVSAPAPGAIAEKLARLGVRGGSDLLFLLPLRYEDRTRLVPIGALPPGMHAVFEGEVLLA